MRQSLTSEADHAPAASIVTTQIALYSPEVAVMTVSPGTTPVTLPDALTVATAVLLDVQVTELVPVIVLSTVAVSVSLPVPVMVVLDLFRLIALGLL